MADSEGKHHASLVARRQLLFKEAARRVDRSWFEDVEAPDAVRHGCSWARQALQVALESEVKAHDFSPGPCRTWAIPR